MNENEFLKNAVHENVVLLKLDAEKEGKALAETYHVRGYPTFLTVNQDGETMDRWMGYGDPESFVETMKTSLADPTTIEEKFARYRKEPTESDAFKLAEIRNFEGHHAEAVALYRRADELNPMSDVNYEARIFGAMAEGSRDGLFSLDDLKAQADLVMDSENRSGMDAMEVASTMGSLARKQGDMSLYTPYLKAAFDATEGTDDKQVMSYREHYQADHALYVLGDEKKAVEYRKANMPEGWMENANQLNSFAWWCFENDINLEEADRMARKGIELAQPGNERANIYDTLAEICNARDNCADAVEFIRLAIADDGDNEYFKKQLARFEALLAEKDG